MSWYLALTFLNIDAQKNPTPAILVFLALMMLLWFFVAQARRRDDRKAARGRDLSNWRSRQPPRY